MSGCERWRDEWKDGWGVTMGKGKGAGGVMRHTALITDIIIIREMIDVSE